MKKKTQFILFVLLITSFTGTAKDRSGVYMTSADFINNNLVFEGDCKNGTKIKMHDFFYSRPTVTLIHDGEKRTYKKSELYGFRNCNNETYRFYRNDAYQIAEAGNVFIYTQERNIAQTKGFKVVKAYYFSTTANGDIMPLTLSNLRRAYAGNDKFQDLLDQYMSGDNVADYDMLHKSFKINILFAKAVNRQ